jgi:hypothetical protein
VQPELKLRHDPEVAAPAPQAPVEVRVLGGRRANQLTVGGDQLVRHDVVAGQSVLASEPAHPAAQGQAADPGVGHVAGGRGQAVGLGGPVERAEQRPALDPGPAAHRVDPHPAQHGEVDHQPVVRHGVAGDVVTAAPDADLEVVIAGVAHRGGDVPDAGAPHDQTRVPVDHRVPDAADPVVAGAAGPQHRAVQAGVQRGGHDRPAHDALVR